MAHSELDAAPLPAPPAATPLESKPPSRVRALIRSAVVGLLFLAVVLTLQRSWRELAEHPWQIDHAAVAVALGLWVVTSLGAGICWLVVTRAIGVRLPIGQALRVFCTSNLGKYLPGKVLHVLARVYLVQQQGVPLAIGTTSAMLDVLLYVAAGMVLALLAVPMALSVFTPQLGLERSPPLVIATAGLAVVIGLGLLHPRVLNAVLELGGRFVPRLRGLRFELRYGTILAAFALYVLLWLIITAAVYAGVRSVADVQPSVAPILGAVFALSYVTGLIVPLPAGIGGREAVMIALFPFFMPAPAALVATILNRLLQVVAESICAGLVSVLVRK